MRRTAKDYLSEVINYGGEHRTRGSVIAELRRDGVPRKYIDAYMMGAKEVQCEKAKDNCKRRRHYPLYTGNN